MPREEEQKLDELRVCDLGPLMVAQAGQVRSCAGPKQAAILAILTMNANRRVPVDELVVGAWGYDAVVSTSTVENHVWRLRRLLDPSYSRSSTSVLVNDSGGYLLRLTERSLDSSLFASLAERAGTALGADRIDEALKWCDQALSLWRGVPYDAVAHVASTAAVTARLEEIRGQVAERRIEALICSRRSEEALADLEVLTEQFPYRERLWVHRMTALASIGRVEDALQTYQRVRTMMRNELGIDPGPELQRLQSRILGENGEPETAQPVGSSSAVDRIQQVHLPRRSLPLLGRGSEMKRLLAEIETEPLVTVTGPGGSGKTRLAIEAARSAADRFTDGVWFADLTTVSDPSLVADTVATTIGLRVAGDDMLASLSEYTADRAVLIVLDNCEHVLDSAAAVADAMVAPDSSSVLLVTSRQPLSLDNERVFALAPLPVNSGNGTGAEMSSSAELFLARLGRDLAGADELAVVEKICQTLDGLPLAIELAAARAQTFTLVELLAQVSDDPSRLGRVGRGDDDHRATLWSAIEWSHRLLGPAERAIHRRLSALPGPFTLPVATAVAQGPDLHVEEIPDALARLVHRSMLASTAPTVAGRSTVFRQLDTVRAHATQVLEDTGENAITIARRDRFVRHLINSRPRLGMRAEKAHFDNLDDAYPAVRATLQGAVTTDPDPKLLMAGLSLHFHAFYRHRLVERRNWATSVAEVAYWGQETEPAYPEVVLFRLGHASGHLLSGDLGIARIELARAIPFVPQVPDDLVLDLAEQLAGATQSAWARNEYDTAQELSRLLERVASRSTDPHIRLLADQADFVSGLMNRDPSATAVQAEALYDRGVSADNLMTQWTACTGRAVAALLMDDSATGLVWIDRLISAHAYFGSGGGGGFLESLANLAAMSGDLELAVRMHAAGFAETRRAGMVWPVQLVTSALIEHTRTALDHETYTRLWSEGAELTYEQVARERGLAPSG